MFGQAGAWLHLGKFRGEARLGSWLYRIAANAALAVVRRRRDIPKELDPATLSMPDHASRVTDIHAVRGAIADHPGSLREAIWHRGIAGLTYKEIAAHQGVGVQIVKSRLSRARAALAARLEVEPRKS